MADNLRIQQVKRKVSKDKREGKAPRVYDIIKTESDFAGVPPKGEKFSTCKTCGKTFEQDFMGERNVYSNYKTCLDCRHKERKKKEKESDIDEGKLASGYFGKLNYTPLEWQMKAHKDLEKNRFQVLCCGNRSGKDRYTNMAGIMYFVDCLNENRHIDNPEIVPSVYWWQLAPTEKLALQNWRELKQFFPKEWVVAVSDSTMTMQTIGGGIIEVRSAYDPESLVGVGLDLVTITEAARIKNLDVVWANIEARLSSPSRGRIKDRMGKKYGLGKAIINSSPLGKNYFYKMWTWGQKNHPDFSSDWVSYQLPWTCNPSNKELSNQIKHTKYGDITYGEDLRRRLGDRAYRQNYLGDFLASGGTVFGDFTEKCLVDLYSGEFINYSQTKRKEFIENWQKPRPYTTYRLAWDIATGSSGDTPTLGIRDNETYNIVKLIDLYGKKYEKQYEEIAYWSRVYNYAPCVFSSTGHTACVGQLEKKGVMEIVINEQGGNKPSYVQSLERATQNGVYKILDDGSKVAQTVIFQMEDYTEKNGKYSNDTENHDDWVSMLYLMFYDFSVKQFEVPFMGLMSSLE